MRLCHARTGFVTPSDDVECRAKCPPAVRTGTVPHCPHHPGDTLTGGALKNGARRVPADRPVGIITPDAPIGTLSRSTRSLPSRRSWCRSGASLVSYHLHLLGTTPRGCRGTAQSCGTQGCAWLLRGAAPAVGVLWGQTRIRAGRLWMGSRQQSRLLTIVHSTKTMRSSTHTIQLEAKRPCRMEGCWHCTHWHGHHSKGMRVLLLSKGVF
jgi:hypothetical protein